MFTGADTGFWKRDGKILVAKQLGSLGGVVSPPSGVWEEEAFAIWAFTSTRIAYTYTTIPSDFAL